MDDKMSTSEEHYSLRWNNHQSHLLRAFEALLQAETLVDVTLVCSERRVRAHKVLLGACSPLFRRIFSENPCKHPVIVLKDFQGWEVQAVVDFMYRGEVSVAQEQLRTVIRAGESLQVRGLVDQDRLMADDSPSVTPLPDRSPIETEPAVRTPSVHAPSPEPPSKIPAWAGPEPEPCASPIPRRKQARPRRRSGDGPHDLSRSAATPPPENLSLKRSPKDSNAHLSLKDIRLISAGRGPGSGGSRARSSPSLKMEGDERHSPEHVEMQLPPRLFPSHQDMPFPPTVSALTLTPPHMFGLDSPLSLFPPGMDHSKLYNPLMELSDPRHPPLDSPMFTNVKKKWRPKGQHSAPRGGPPRSWTNAELTEALQHVWNKKMTTSQASRIFGIPYNSLLMYVRGKYGKSLKLEQLRKDCIGGPLDMLNMGPGNNNNNQPSGKHHDKEDHHMNQSNQRPASSEPDILSNPMFNPFSQSFYPEFPPGFPMPLNMLHLLPPSDKMRDMYSQNMPLALDSMSAGKEDDCKSDRSKENSADEDNSDIFRSSTLSRDERREIMQQNGQD